LVLLGCCTSKSLHCILVAVEPDQQGCGLRSCIGSVGHYVARCFRAFSEAQLQFLSWMLMARLAKLQLHLIWYFGSYLYLMQLELYCSQLALPI
jgi:hypothetical protein